MGDNEERFKTTTFGGYDKEEVLQELQKMNELLTGISAKLAFIVDELTK